MLAAIKGRHDRELHAELDELQQKLGYASAYYLPRETVRAVLLATKRYIGALYDSNSGHLHPPQLHNWGGSRGRTCLVCGSSRGPAQMASGNPPAQ